ncbi:MAG TPA: lamin tail domain-containing protein, partial [Turneriella sp.]|nr:lamin tail domain-containing protein [Turneriella sp.]
MRRIYSIIILALVTMFFSCRTNPFGDTEKSFEEFNLYTTDFTAQTDGGAKVALLNVIQSSRATLHCVFSKLTLTDVTDALIARASAGVQVKVAFDRNIKDTDAGSIALQASAKFTVITTPSDGNESQLLYGNANTNAFVRHNFCMADERFIYISTAAPDDNQMRKMPNVALKIGSPQFGLARDFLREANMFGQLLFGNGKSKTDFTTKFTALDQVIGVYWGPQESALDVLGTELSEANKSVDFYSTSFLATNTSATKADRDVPTTLKGLETTKGLPLKKYFSSAALFAAGSQAYTLSNPHIYTGAAVVGANIFVVDRGAINAKTYIYTGALRKEGNSSDDSVLIVLKGRRIADAMGAYLDSIGTASTIVTNTGDTSAAGEVVVSELMWMGSYSNDLVSDSADEFIEFYNTTSSPINMSGWKFACTKDGITANSAITLPPGAIIGSGGYFVVAKKDSGAFGPAVNHIDTKVGITDDSYQCKLGNGKTSAGVYGITDFGSVTLDTVGDGSTKFNAAGWDRGSNKGSPTYIKRSMERIDTTVGSGVINGAWQTNVFEPSQNIYVVDNYRTQTFATPGAAASNYLPSVAFERGVFFTTDNTKVNGRAKITVLSPSANTNAGVAEGVTVTVTSTSDSTGISLTLTETGVNTGLFETGTLLNFTTSASVSNEIKVVSGDTITATYTFNTVTYTATALWFPLVPVINEIGVSPGSNDFVEIFNPNTQAIDLAATKLYLQRDSACNLSNGVTENLALSGTIPAGGYFTLAKSGHTLPNIDAATIGNIDVGYCVILSATNKETTASTDNTIVDWVTIAGTGDAENSSYAPTTTTDGAISRIPNGADTDMNANDFKLKPATPGTINGTPTFTSTPTNGAAGVLTNANVVLTFNEAMNNGMGVLTLAGTSSGTQANQPCVWSVGDTVCTVTPASAFQTNETVTVTLNNFKNTSLNLAPLVPGFNFTTVNPALTPTVTNVVVTSTNPNNGTTPFNTGATTLTITGTNFTGTTAVNLDDLNGANVAVNTPLTSVTIDSATQITATVPAGVRTNASTGWNVRVTNASGTNATSSVKFVPQAGLLISEVVQNAGAAANEFIELYNTTGLAIDIGPTGLNLRLHTRNSSGVDTNKTLTATGASCAINDTTIPAHGFYLIVSTAAFAQTWWPKRNMTYSAGITQDGAVYISLSSTTDLLVIDKVGWGTVPPLNYEGTVVSALGANQSIERKPAGDLGHSTD